MPLPYSTPASAWRFIIILHRLASLQPGQPLRISPAGKSSINTARAKLFQGRAHIAETHDLAIARYSRLAMQTIIHTDKNSLTIIKADKFDDEYSSLKDDTFTSVYRGIQHKLLTTTGGFSIPSFGAALTTPQISALKAFLSAIPRVIFVGVTPTSLVLQR